jgi:hypothetical protein
MRASLGGNWTAIESTVGNVTIDQNFYAVKTIGTNAWGPNGMYSTANYLRSAGNRYQWDLWVGGGVCGTLAGLVSSAAPAVAQADFKHGVSILSTGFIVLEANTIITTGPLGPNSNYRVRITPGSTKGALYEIQGGILYPLIGGSTWTTLADTRGTSAVTTASLKIANAGYYNLATGVGSYFSDVRVY